MKLLPSQNRGFTLPELIVALGIFTILAGVTSVNLLTSQRQATLAAVSDQLVTDLRQQQMKAMTGDRESRTVPDSYGIYFGPGSYTLFHGSVFNPSDTDNFEVDLDSNMQFINLNLADSSIIFGQESGVFSNYTATSNSFTLLNTADQTSLTFQLNRFGVITSIH